MTFDGSAADNGTITRSAADATTTGNDHQRWRRDGNISPTRRAASASVSTRISGAQLSGPSAGSVVIRVSVTLALSVDGLTIRAVFIAALAIASLLLTGWRKPARAEPRSPRGPLRRDATGIVVEHLDAPTYRRPGPLRRAVAIVASGGIGILGGIIAAIVIAFGVALSVIWLTNLLQQ
jgi:hypothetical protein